MALLDIPGSTCRASWVDTAAGSRPPLRCAVAAIGSRVTQASLEQRGPLRSPTDLQLGKPGFVVFEPVCHSPVEADHLIGNGAPGSLSRTGMGSQLNTS